MTTDALGDERRIVTCDDCGRPYAAVIDGWNVRPVGPTTPECPNCGCVAFSRLTL